LDGNIFGLNIYLKKSRGNLLFGMSMLWKLIFIKNNRPDKSDLIDALKVYEKNKTDILDRSLIYYRRDNKSCANKIRSISLSIKLYKNKLIEYAYQFTL